MDLWYSSRLSSVHSIQSFVVRCIKQKQVIISKFSYRYLLSYIRVAYSQITLEIWATLLTLKLPNSELMKLTFLKMAAEAGTMLSKYCVKQQREEETLDTGYLNFCSLGWEWEREQIAISSPLGSAPPFFPPRKICYSIFEIFFCVAIREGVCATPL